MWSYTQVRGRKSSHELRAFTFFLYFWNKFKTMLSWENLCIRNCHFFSTICLSKICPIPKVSPLTFLEAGNKNLIIIKLFLRFALNLFWSYMNGSLLVTDTLSTWTGPLRNRECTPPTWLLLLWQQCSDPWGETE